MSLHFERFCIDLHILKEFALMDLFDLFIIDGFFKLIYSRILARMQSGWTGYKRPHP